MTPHIHVSTKKTLNRDELAAHERAHGAAAAAKPPVPVRQSSSCDTTEHSAAQVAASAFLHLPAFDYMMGLVILVNFLFVIIESDLIADNPESDLPVWIVAASWGVLGIFVLELMLRLFVLRSLFWHDAWNLFDFTIVVTDTFFSIFGLLFGSLFPVSALRVLRLCKLARVSKVFRVFPELRLMMAGLIGSLKAIFWGLILLIFCLLVWAVIAVQFVNDVNKRVTANGVYEQLQCDRCPRAFASVYESVLTLFQQLVAGDGWGQVTLPVMEESGMTTLFFMGTFVTIGMAVLNLILGVVVNIATQAHDSLKTEIDDEKLVERMEAHSHLLALCSELDADSNGNLTKEELFTGYKKSESLRETLRELDVGEEDMEILWTILDEEKTGRVCYNNFVSRCYGMKLSNTQFMLAYIKFYITQIRFYISDQMAEMHHSLDELEEEIEVEDEKIKEGQEKIIEGVIQIEAELGMEGELLKEAECDGMPITAGLARQRSNSSDGNKKGVAKQIGQRCANGQSTTTDQSPTAVDWSIASAGFQMQLESLGMSGEAQADLLRSIRDMRNHIDLCLPSTPTTGLTKTTPSLSDESSSSEALFMLLRRADSSATIVKLSPSERLRPAQQEDAGGPKKTSTGHIRSLRQEASQDTLEEQAHKVLL